MSDCVSELNQMLEEGTGKEIAGFVAELRCTRPELASELYLVTHALERLRRILREKGVADAIEAADALLAEVAEPIGG